MPKEKQKDFFQHLYPEGDKLKGRETEYLLRSAALICATYAYHRCVLPTDAFKSVKILTVHDVPSFNNAHPKAKLYLEAIQNLSTELENKNISNFIFAVCEEQDPEKIVESLRFELDYSDNSMHVQLPNATNVRVGSKWDFVADLAEVLKRIRLLSVHLAALPKKTTSSIMIQFKKKLDELPPAFKYRNYEPIEVVLESLPIAKLTCEPQGVSMTVELRSKYFEADVKDVQRDVEEALGIEDEKLSSHPSDFDGSSPSRTEDVETSSTSSSVQVLSKKTSLMDTQQREKDGALSPANANQMDGTASHSPIPEDEVRDHTPIPENDTAGDAPDTEDEVSPRSPTPEGESRGDSTDPEDDVRDHTPIPEDDTARDAPDSEDEVSARSPTSEGESRGDSTDPEDDVSPRSPIPEDDTTRDAPDSEDEVSPRSPTPEGESPDDSTDPESEVPRRSPSPEELEMFGPPDTSAIIDDGSTRETASYDVTNVRKRSASPEDTSVAIDLPQPKKLCYNYLGLAGYSVTLEDRVKV